MAAARAVARRFPQPPVDYIFNNLIADISKKISNEELMELKRRFKDIIPRGIRSPQDMFDTLNENGYIDSHNILYIQQIIRVLGKEDLLEVAARYIKMFEEDEILHFFQKTTNLADGCRIVEFHVVGHNISNRRDLEAFRREVSTILLVPLHEVIVTGVQETSSTRITLMLPTIYVEFLKHQLERNKQYMIESLIRQGVDEVIISTQDFKLERKGTHFLAAKIKGSEEIVNKERNSKVARKRKLSTSCSKTSVKPSEKKSIVTQKNAKISQSVHPMSRVTEILKTA